MSYSRAEHEYVRQRALALLRGGDWDESEHPRDEDGKFTAGGGGSDSSSGLSDAPLGEGYSKDAHVSNGKVHTSNVYDAARALAEGRAVELKQSRQLSTLIEHLGRISNQMVKAGKSAPDFNLCNVSVKGTNLFCAQTAGIPRIKMPQLDSDQTKDFVKHLEKQGYSTEKARERSDHLRATQNQLIGAKVAKITAQMRDDPKLDRRLVVSRDNYILDGHHHWAAQIGIDAADNKLGDAETKITRIDIGIIDLLNEAEKFTGGKGHKKDWDESEHPRDEDGKFTDAGGGEAASAESGGGKVDLNPEVIDVGGDQWNRETAVRLEREYETAAKPALEKMTAGAVGHSISAKEEPEGPISWSDLTNDTKSVVESDWFSNTHDNFYQSEYNNWIENGDQKDVAMATVATNFTDGSDEDWARSYIDDLRAARKGEEEKDFPFTDDQLINALIVDYETGYSGDHDPSISFDDDKLGVPESFDTSPSFPGIESQKPADFLTEEMRKDLIDGLTTAFKEEADRLINYDKIEPPDYLAESAKEQQNDHWTDVLDDQAKFKLAKDYGYVKEPEVPVSYMKVDELPKHYLPFDESVKMQGVPYTYNKTDYEKTQRLARYLSIEHAADLMVQRGIVKDRAAAQALAQSMDERLWRDWKSSPRTGTAKALQVAISDEFGTRLRGIEHDEGVMAAHSEWGHEFVHMQDAFEATKAYVRAKWDVSQFLLDKAGINTINVYRSVEAPVESSNIKEPIKIPNIPSYFDYRKVDINLQRNGANATTTDVGVANYWGGNVVLRISAPRTAALGLPVYGQNVFNEHEVVLIGGAWKKWDAWKNRAPPVEDYPIQ